MTGLTRRQRDVYEFLVDYVRRHNMAPTLREMAEHLNLTSISTVHEHLVNLERKGFIAFTRENEARNIVIGPPRPVADDGRRTKHVKQLQGWIQWANRVDQSDLAQALRTSIELLEER